MTVGQSTVMLDAKPLSRASSLPQWVRVLANAVFTPEPVGASLLAMGAGQALQGFQPSNSFMAMICSATWISFCWRLMAWRRIKV